MDIWAGRRVMVTGGATRLEAADERLAEEAGAAGGYRPQRNLWQIA